jgi:probable DNA metabolism protein
MLVFPHYDCVHLQIPLSDQVDVSGFHMEATRLLGQQVPPQSIEWSAAPAQSVGEEPLESDRASIRNRAARAIIPQSFVRMSELVVLHRDPERFDLLYRALWRLMYEPDLKNDPGDADLSRLRQMAQSVRRDIQKMKTRLAFRPLTIKGNVVSVSWYEPTHYVSEVVGGWLALRDPATHWILLTPDRSMRWDGERLLSAPAVAPLQQPAATLDDAGWARLLDALPWT